MQNQGASYISDCYFLYLSHATSMYRGTSAEEELITQIVQDIGTLASAKLMLVDEKTRYETFSALWWVQLVFLTPHFCLARQIPVKKVALLSECMRVSVVIVGRDQESEGRNGRPPPRANRVSL